jgi:type II secretory pathway predicted ATPase ExeA
MTPTHREALANLQYGLSARKGLTVLVGEAGAGKTTLIRTALEEWRNAHHLVAHLSNPTLTRAEFFEYLANAFELPAGSGSSKARFLADFTALVTRRHDEGLITGLVIDEAQSLTDELLEEVRLLVNIETATEKLFQVLLVGQPELGARLNQPGLRQIKQRIALRCTLATLDVRQVAAYVAGRIQIAGGVAAQVFTREAVMAIHQHSGGIPRVISVISDNALLAGFAAGVRPVTSAMVEGVCREFDIQKLAGAPQESFEPVTPEEVSPLHGASERSGAERARRGAQGSAEQKGTERAAQETGNMFQQYIAAGKRRFSFF